MIRCDKEFYAFTGVGAGLRLLAADPGGTVAVTIKLKTMKAAAIDHRPKAPLQEAGGIRQTTQKIGNKKLETGRQDNGGSC